MGVAAASETAQRLAHASADLMQSLDHLLDTLGKPEADQPVPTDSAAHESQPHLQALAASVGTLAKLSSSRSQADAQVRSHPPRFHGYDGEWRLCRPAV